MALLVTRIVVFDFYVGHTNQAPRVPRPHGMRGPARTNNSKIISQSKDKRIRGQKFNGWSYVPARTHLYVRVNLSGQFLQHVVSRVIAA
ncbi:hypothetical protein BOCO_0274 [Bombiscardovia coagulans]|uniref:Uncharacterized protein n=1 Tax=Bombiscardovia coagulans TaxID=686666 RepID=A0A261EUY1_9BIFI|nr:hypothetical protein BOCO_0274 [Bombiscardovia coagulans]